jgi:hypothetical protein
VCRTECGNGLCADWRARVVLADDELLLSASLSADGAGSAGRYVSAGIGVDHYTGPMATEVRADPVALAQLAKANLNASVALGDAYRAVQGSLAIPAEAFGDATVGASVRASHQAAADDADTAVGALVGVYEIDSDKLYQTAFVYEKADEDAAAKIHHRGPGRQYE